MGTRILLVEGPDDLHVMSSLFQAHDVPEVFKVQSANGLERLIKSLPVRLKESDLERIAIVVDADDDAQARWQSVVDTVQATGIGVLPTALQSGGTNVLFGSGIRFGAWVMPDNQLPGILETFLAHLVRANDPLLPRVDRFLSDIPAEEKPFAANRHPKARMHSWLAVQKDPGRPLGLAITASFLDAHAPAVRPFLNWINDVLVH